VNPASAKPAASLPQGGHRVASISTAIQIRLICRDLPRQNELESMSGLAFDHRSSRTCRSDAISSVLSRVSDAAQLIVIMKGGSPSNLIIKSQSLEVWRRCHVPVSAFIFSTVRN
jgi:hypothetical protein